MLVFLGYETSIRTFLQLICSTHKPTFSNFIQCPSNSFVLGAAGLFYFRTQFTYSVQMLKMPAEVQRYSKFSTMHTNYFY